MIWQKSIPGKFSFQGSFAKVDTYKENFSNSFAKINSHLSISHLNSYLLDFAIGSFPIIKNTVYIR